MTAAERTEILAAVLELRESVAYKTGAGRVRRPVARLQALLDARTTSTTTPPVPTATSFWDQHMAIVIDARNADPNTLWDAGVRAVAFAINAANTIEVQHAAWARFQRGNFFVTRGTTAIALMAEAKAFADLLTPPVTWTLVDTENLKADEPHQDRFQLQALFYAELRRLLPVARIGNITYGWHQDGSVVNYKALSDNVIEPWWEAYNGDAASWDVRAVTEKLNTQGFRPARICLGHRLLPMQVPVWKQLSAEGRAARGCMLWDVGLGEAQEALRAGVKLT